MTVIFVRGRLRPRVVIFCRKTERPTWNEIHGNCLVLGVFFHTCTLGVLLHTLEAHAVVGATGMA